MTKRYIPGINLVGNPERYPVSEQLEMLRRVGWGGFFTGWNPKNTKERAQAADRLGLIYQSIHSPITSIHKMWKDGSEGDTVAQMLIDCVTDCAQNGIPVMVIHPFIGFWDHTPTQIGLERYARIVEAADRLGVQLGFENVEGEEYLQALMQAFWDAPSCGFCWDTGHEQCYNDGKDMMALYGKKLCHTHLNDNLGVYDPKLTWENDFHLVMGDGIVDWKSVMDRIDASPYEGILMCELTLASKPGRHTHDAYAAMPLEAFYTFALERMRKILDRTLTQTTTVINEI
ncbi:MAG: sugar phosphate isomerase/epimerase [Clostridia bacterium]|nr:sugar phosphate isomerase/epimerase [Clostridia bacterium]